MNSKNKDILILIARLIVGGIFIASGWMKVSAIGMTVGYFAQMGISAFLTYIVSYAELIGGILLVLGLWSYLTSVVLAIIMIFAVWYTYSLGVQVYMTPLAIFSALLSLIASGSGKYAIKGKKSSEGVTE